MPTYEYVCSKCHRQFDLFQPISDKPIQVCPKDLCREKTWGRGKVKRVIGAGAGLIFKGSGFYTTDYRSEKYKEAAKKETPAAPAAASGTDGKANAGKSDAKSAKPSSGAAEKKSS